MKLKAALKYHGMGFSVIPIKASKKPYLTWAEYQEKTPTVSQVKKWWKTWPDANIAIVTGKVSGIDVVDCDSEKGRDALNEFLPDTLVMPISKTPKGWHYYFKHSPGLSNGVRVITDCDVRTTGGYIIVPPSKNGEGKNYSWMPDLRITEVEPAIMPDMLFSVLQDAGQANSRSQYKNGIKPYNKKIHYIEAQHLQPQQTATNRNIRNISFDEGFRDGSIFHIGNCLFKGGMDSDNILKCLYFIGSNCNPPFPEKEIKAKIESVLKRAGNQNRNLTAEVREWVSATWGNITATEAIQSATNATFEDRKKIRVILGRLVNEGTLERVPNKNGVYRKVDNEVEAIDFLNADTETVDLLLPFGLHEKAETMPGNIIVVAGSPDAGKTAFLLNVIRQNQQSFEIHYFNSEMGSSELKKRLDKFDDIVLSDWNFKPWERSDNFADVIKPGEGKINIIDFLEIHDNFYEIGGKLAEIHKKLKGSIAIVALQKNPGVKVGLGGYRGLEKPRLYLAMDSGMITITKAKNWATSENPNGLQLNFKIVEGCRLIKTQDWHRPAK